jgi:hypothetical protein
MKLLRASSEPGVIQRLKSALEDAGIECVIRNELTSGLAPEIPISDSTPELWITEDDSLPQAQQILADLKSTVGAGRTSWTCAGCGEALDPQFTSCWKCGSARERNSG